MIKVLKTGLKSAFFILIGYFSYLMILITWQYIPIDFKAAFLNIKQDVIGLKHYQWAFFTHVYSSIFVLLIGLPQFSTLIRLKAQLIHRYLGLIYVGLILFVSSPSGLIMAYYANGGWGSKTSFILQAILWFYFTYKAFSAAKKHDWSLHQKMMIRSYALTLSAISLRLFKWGIVQTLEWPPMDTYKLVAWLGWTFNLAVVEIGFIFQKK